MREHEADACDWWNAALHAARECLDSSEAKLTQLRAISVSGQMQDVILLPHDADSPPPPVILYSDSRATIEAEEVEALGGGIERIVRVTGMRQAATSLLAKLRWLDRHCPDAASSCSRLLIGGHDYVTGRLCGSWVSDATTASTTGLTKISDPGSYAEELINDVGLSHWLPKLPPLVPPDEPCGRVTLKAAEQLGNPELEGLPVFHSCGDAGACTLGCGAGVVGPQYAYVGTSGWVAGSFNKKSNLNAVMEGRQSPELNSPTGVFTLAHPDPSLVFRTGSIMTAGGNLSWASNLFASNDSTSSVRDKMAITDELVSCIQVGSGGVLYLPFLQGERCPFEDGDVRASFLGLSMETTRGTLLRAVMEGVAFGLLSAQEGMATDTKLGSDRPPLRMVGGGARSPVWPVILANVFNQCVEVLADSQEVGVKGAAILAGRWLGWHTGFAPKGEWVKTERQIVPNPQYVNTYEELYSIYRGCQNSLQHTNHQLAIFRKKITDS